MKVLDELLTAVYRDDIHCVGRLVGAGTDVNARDADGRTALMHAVLASPPSEKMLTRLIDLGASLDLHDTGEQWTALHFAARDQKTESVQVLIGRRAKIDPADVFGNTPLWRCVMTASDPKTVSVLVAAGANPDLPNRSGVSARALAQRLGKGSLLSL